MNKIYHVVELDPSMKLCGFEDREPIDKFESISDAMLLAHKLFQETGRGFAVWNDNSQGFQAISRPSRDRSGRFQ